MCTVAAAFRSPWQAFGAANVVATDVDDLALAARAADLGARTDGPQLESRRRHRGHRHHHHSHTHADNGEQQHDGGGWHRGTATFYTQDGTTGACGQKVGDSAHVVALCASQYRRYCGQSMRVISTKTHKSVTVTVRDECPECACNHLDLSVRRALDDSSDPSDGRVRCTRRVSQHGRDRRSVPDDLK